MPILFGGEFKTTKKQINKMVKKQGLNSITIRLFANAPSIEGSARIKITKFDAQAMTVKGTILVLNKSSEFTGSVRAVPNSEKLIVNLRFSNPPEFYLT